MTTQPSSKDYSVLLIDDNPINRKLHSRLLQRKNLAVTEVSTQQEAIQLLTTHVFDMVFVHVSFTTTTACDICDYIKQLEDDIAVIAITSEDSNTKQELIDRFGFTDVLFRPVQETDLQDILRIHLHNLGKDSHQVLFDQEAFESFYQDVSLRQEIIELLLHDENSSIPSIEEAFATKDNDTIYKKIHYLKGSFNYMKMTRMVSIAIEILEFLKADKLSEAMALEETFLANYQVLRDTLKLYLKSL